MEYKERKKENKKYINYTKYVIIVSLYYKYLCNIVVLLGRKKKNRRNTYLIDIVQIYHISNLLSFYVIIIQCLW